MICETSGLNWDKIGLILALLFVIGIGYNWIMAKLGCRKDRYIAFMVAGGVLFTLGGAALISWQAALLALACFTASGIPMIVGDMWRHMEAEEAAMLRMIHEAGNEQ